MTTLLVGHAMAEDIPLGALLREVGQPAAASDAEAGRLEQCLNQLQLSTDLTTIAKLWPAALRPAQRRLDALPSPLLFQLPMIQTLLWLVLIGVIQGWVIGALSLRVFPTLAVIGAEAGSSLSADALNVAPVGVVVFAVLLPIATLLMGRSERMGWRRHYVRAQQAAMAAAMAEVDAPQSARSTLAEHFPALSQAGAHAEELDMVTAASLSLAEQSHRRTVAMVRLLGIGGLALVALLVTAHIYGTISTLPVPM